jgi:hypothetical protein
LFLLESESEELELVDPLSDFTSVLFPGLTESAAISEPEIPYLTSDQPDINIADDSLKHVRLVLDL